MPFISFFADEEDASLLLNWLNADDEIAFIVQDTGVTNFEDESLSVSYSHLVSQTSVPPSFQQRQNADLVGQQRVWKAVKTIDRLTTTKYSLWHVPTGQLPLRLHSGGYEIIPNPLEGWIEERLGADARTPYFGPAHPAEIRLELWLRHRPYTDAERASLRKQDSWYIGKTDLLPISGFQWSGDWPKVAPKQTWRWWESLKEWISQNAIKIGSFKDKDEETEEFFRWSFWAFPSALSKLKSGMKYYADGRNLDDEIRNANLIR